MYMDNQPTLTTNMRSILVDWLVEVQENFELNHETLYLAVKLVDTYLSKQIVTKELLQLVGATSLFLACKFDVRNTKEQALNTKLFKPLNTSQLDSHFDALPSISLSSNFELISNVAVHQIVFF